MTKKKFLVGIIMALGWIIPFISFGQTQNKPICSTCSSSPGNIILINNFTTDILSTIKTIGTEGRYAGKQVPPSRFDSGKFTPPKQGIISKALRRAQESLGSILAIKRINLEFGNLANAGDSLAVMAGNKTILRDWKKMLQVEQNIDRKKYELSVGGGRTDTIGGVTLKKMQSILKKYQNLGILTNGSIIEEGAQYGDLILLLGRMNASIKHLVAIGGKDRAKGEKDIFIEIRTRGEVSLQIESDAIDQIKNEYDCTRGYACEQSRTSIKDQLKKIVESMKSGVKNARSDMSKANQDLKKAYSRENLQKTFWKENALVNQLSGTLSSLNKRRKKASQEISNAVTPSQTTTEKKQEGQQNINNMTDQIVTTNQTQQQIIDNFTSRIESTQNTIENEANKIIGSYETTDISDIMTYIVILSQKVNAITENILGSKDSETNCLIKNLGLLCEKQCSNIGNKKCYY